MELEKYTHYKILERFKGNIKGIYKITNIVNNKIYIGSSINIGRRIREHFGELRRNTHHSKYLQNSWNKYEGFPNFKFEVLEESKFPEDYSKEYIFEYLELREQYYMELLNPEYNMTKEAQIHGHKLTQETIEKIRLKNIGRKNTEEFKIDMARIKNGNKQIYCYNKRGQIVGKFKTQQEVADYLNVVRTAVSNNLIGRSNFVKNHFLLYKNIIN